MCAVNTEGPERTWPCFLFFFFFFFFFFLPQDAHSQAGRRICKPLIIAPVVSEDRWKIKKFSGGRTLGRFLKGEVKFEEGDRDFQAKRIPDIVGWKGDLWWETIFHIL